MGQELSASRFKSIRQSRKIEFRNEVDSCAQEDERLTSGLFFMLLRIDRKKRASFGVGAPTVAAS
jgi:hypothetical protein